MRRLPVDRWMGAGYTGLLGFFALEWAFRQPGSASSMKASEKDNGSTKLLIAAYAVGPDLPWISRLLPGPVLPVKVAQAGLAVEACGLLMRAWSMGTLGKSYTRTLRVQENQEPIGDGPYRLVRHPGYLGSLATWYGFALTSRSVPAIVLIGGLFGAAYTRRIAVEEELLSRDLPGYAEYARRTSRLVPWVW